MPRTRRPGPNLTATSGARLTGDNGAPAPTVETVAAQAAAQAAAQLATPPAPSSTPPADPAPTTTAAAAPAPQLPTPPAPAPAPTPTPAPATVAAAAAPAPTTSSRRQLDVRAAADLLAAANRGEVDQGTLTAALSDVTTKAGSAPDTSTSNPQWLGQLWDGVSYTRRFVDAVQTGAPIRSLTIKGWRWKVPPVVAPYTGDKAAVPSNAATTEPVEVKATRLAGAHDIDRAFFDLGDGDFVAAYWAAMAESYAAQSDKLVADAIVAAAQDTGAHDSTLAAIVAVAVKVMGSGTPSFVAIGTGAFEAMAATNEKDALAFLGGRLSLDGTGDLGNVDLFVSPFLDPLAVAGGIRQAATFHELNPQLRVTVANVAQGGIDAGLFGYAGAIINKPAALAKGTVTAPVKAATAPPAK